jgi:hypothetical protein
MSSGPDSTWLRPAAVRPMLRRSMSSLPRVLRGDVHERSSKYREALSGLTPDVLPEAIPGLVRIYWATRDLFYRNTILRLLVDCDRPELEAFFAAAHSRERHHSMKVTALRGLAQFADEKDIGARLAKLRESLRKVELSTPLNFVEYEILLGPFALPYLVKRYDYASLIETLAQVQAQYDRMPDAAKGIVTTTETGEVIQLVTREEYDRRTAEAMAELRSRTSADLFK